MYLIIILKLECLKLCTWKCISFLTFGTSVFSFWNCKPCSPVDKLLQVAFDIYLIICSLVNNMKTLFLVLPPPPAVLQSFSCKSRFDFVVHLNNSQTRSTLAYRIKSKFLSLASKALYNLFMYCLLCYYSCCSRYVCLFVQLVCAHTSACTELFS